MGDQTLREDQPLGRGPEVVDMRSDVSNESKILIWPLSVQLIMRYYLFLKSGNGTHTHKHTDTWTLSFMYANGLRGGVTIFIRTNLGKIPLWGGAH